MADIGKGLFIAAPIAMGAGNSLPGTGCLCWPLRQRFSTGAFQLREVVTMTPLEIWVWVMGGLTALGYGWFYWHKWQRKKAKKF